MKKFGFLFLFVMVCAASVAAQQRFVAALDGAQEVPANASAGKGTCTIVLNAAQTQITVNCTFSGLGTNLSAAHIHGNAAPGTNAGVLFGFTGLPTATSGSIGPLTFSVTPAQLADMRAHRYYVNLHTASIPGGEIRGQIKQAHTVTDFDGDGRSDPTVFRQSANQFWMDHSLNANWTIAIHGTGTGDIFLNNTCDFDGDGRFDPLLLKLDAGSIATWSIFQSATNTIRTFVFGNFSAASLDTLAISDYDGDGIQDPAVFRRSTGDWWVIQSTAPTFQFVQHWGAPNDFPSIGDYDGDGKADLTAVRVESGARVWWIRSSIDGSFRRIPFGVSATDGVFFFAPFDIDGDSRQDIAVNRNQGGTRTFHVLRSSDGAYVQIGWGLTSDTALFGDYDGDGRTDLVARRNIGGTWVWHILRSSDQTLQLYWWGIATAPADQLVDLEEKYAQSFVQTGGTDE